MRTRNVPIMENSQVPAGPPSRRNILCAGLTAGLAGTVLAGCGQGEQARGTTREESGIRQRAARDTALLIAAYDATAEAHPSLAGELRPLRADLAKHLKAFGGERDTATPSPSSRKAAPEVPAKPRAAKRALADAERGAADARSKDLLEAPPELARLLASVAASGAGHVLLLRS